MIAAIAAMGPGQWTRKSDIRIRSGPCDSSARRLPAANALIAAMTTPANGSTTINNSANRNSKPTRARMPLPGPVLLPSPLRTLKSIWPATRMELPPDTCARVATEGKAKAD